MTHIFIARLTDTVVSDAYERKARDNFCLIKLCLETRRKSVKDLLSDVLKYDFLNACPIRYCSIKSITPEHEHPP
jgi:hypothetical protein